MDSIKNTLSNMTDMFKTRMSEFEAELQKTTSTTSSSTNLAADFLAFRTFIVHALNSLQSQVEIVARGVDDLEMQGRRKIILLHGVEEEAKEETDSVLVNIIKNKLKMNDFTVADIRRSHRMGRFSSSKPRPILFKLVSAGVRDKIWFAKKLLKGTGVTMSEFLTKGRHDVFLAAREKYGVSKCWTKSGCVYILSPDGARHRVLTMADLSGIEAKVVVTGPIAVQTDESDSNKQVSNVKVKTKRAATLKKVTS